MPTKFSVNFIGQGASGSDGKAARLGNPNDNGSLAGTSNNAADGSTGNTIAVAVGQEPRKTPSVAGSVPLGGIIMYSGTVDVDVPINIDGSPHTWYVCNGYGPVNGITIPDLTGRFIRAQNVSAIDINDCGGSDSHCHDSHAVSWNIDHTHSIPSLDVDLDDPTVQGGCAYETGPLTFPTFYAWGPSAPAEDLSAATDGGTTGSGGGTITDTLTHSEEMNVPQYYVLAFLIRVA